MGGKPGEPFPAGDQPSGGESWGDRFKRWKERGKDAAGRGKDWWEKKGKPGLGRAVEKTKEAARDAKEAAAAKASLRKFDKMQMYFVKLENRKRFDVGVRKARSKPQEVSRVVGEARAQLNHGIEALAELKKTGLRFSHDFLEKTVDYLDEVLGDMVNLSEGIRNKLIPDQLKPELKDFKDKFEQLKTDLWALQDSFLAEGQHSNNIALNPFLRYRLARMEIESLRSTLHKIRTVGGLLDDEDEKTK